MAKKVKKNEERDYIVYFGYQISYVGITKHFKTRKKQHEVRRTIYGPKSEKMTEDEAKMTETMLIEHIGLDYLENKIYSVAEKYWDQKGADEVRENLRKQGVIKGEKCAGPKKKRGKAKAFGKKAKATETAQEQQAKENIVYLAYKPSYVGTTDDFEKCKKKNEKHEEHYDLTDIYGGNFEKMTEEEADMTETVLIEHIGMKYLYNTKYSVAEVEWKKEGAPQYELYNKVRDNLEVLQMLIGKKCEGPEYKRGEVEALELI